MVNKPYNLVNLSDLMSLICDYSMEILEGVVGFIIWLCQSPFLQCLQSKLYSMLLIKEATSSQPCCDVQLTKPQQC